MTTALRSRLQFAVHVWKAGRASSGKWFTARFFATKNWTVSRLKARSSFLYPFAMSLLDFWSRINELFLFFGRLKWRSSTWWKQHGGTKQWTRSSNRFYIPFCRTNKRKYFLFQSRVKISFGSCYWIPNLTQSLFSFYASTYHSANFFLFYLFLCDWGDQAS